MNNPDLQSMCKEFGVFRTITEMNQAIEGLSCFAGFQGQGEVSVTVGYYQDAHGVTVTESLF
jgi:hypothetical protein